MKNEAVEKRSLVMVWKKSVNGLYEFMQLMDEMRKIPEINTYLENHTLKNREITHNACFDLEIPENGKGKTLVYLKGSNAAVA